MSTLPFLDSDSESVHIDIEIRDLCVTLFDSVNKEQKFGK